MKGGGDHEIQASRMGEGQMLLFDEGHIVTDIMFGFSPLLSSR